MTEPKTITVTPPTWRRQVDLCLWLYTCAQTGKVEAASADEVSRQAHAEIMKAADLADAVGPLVESLRDARVILVACGDVDGPVLGQIDAALAPLRAEEGEDE